MTNRIDFVATDVCIDGCHNGFGTLPLHLSNSKDVDLTRPDKYVSVWYLFLPD